MKLKNMKLIPGMKLPNGVSLDDFKRALAGSAEAANLVDMLLKDDGYSDLIAAYIRAHADVFPVLVTAL